jgi:hypothetical protein
LRIGAEGMLQAIWVRRLPAGDDAPDREPRRGEAGHLRIGAGAPKGGSRPPSDPDGGPEGAFGP